ncbi:HAD family hydrolase [Paenibacillus sp. GXUN7292]|uniref:HAD family hydrolase n=1 Tax=Paenibacillus sp. GXUN7292 TaxID=3422499 RepID=UPI003D7F0821
MIKALIFDFDGTIVDTETPWYYAYRDLYSSYNVDLPLEVWGQCVGTGFEAFNPHINLEEQTKRSFDHKQLEAFTAEKHNEYMVKQTLRPGIENYLAAAKQAGLRLAIASSSHRHWIEKYLTAFNIGHYFEFIASADDVEKVKPNPELYLKALEWLQIKPAEAIAFEDSRHGLFAAKCAGIKTVVTPNEVTSYMTFENYDLLLSSLADISLDELVKQLSAE